MANLTESNSASCSGMLSGLSIGCLSIKFSETESTLLSNLHNAKHSIAFIIIATFGIVCRKSVLHCIAALRFDAQIVISTCCHQDIRIAPSADKALQIYSIKIRVTSTSPLFISLHAKKNPRSLNIPLLHLA